MRDQRLGTTRRSFLKTAAAGLALGLPGRPILADARADYDLVVISGDPAAATRKALEAMGGISRFVQKGKRVVLKPNMSFATPPERASTTHPMVVATVAQACMDAGAERVVVLDYPLYKAELCLQRSGIQDACRSIRGVYVLPHGLDLGPVEFSLQVQHPSGAGRPGRGHQAPPHPAGCHQGSGYVGPGGPGEVQKPDLIIAGTDPVAVDAYGVTVAPWYGQQFKGRQVEHLLAAHQRGVGKIDLEQLRIFKERA